MTKSPKPAPVGAERRLPAKIFAAVFGAFLGLSLLKFANPPIMEKYTTAPANIYEFLFFSPWPISWAYFLLAVVVVIGLFVARRHHDAPVWLIALPAAWAGWQVLATIGSIDPRLSNPTLVHFFSCVVCFYLGLFALSRVESLGLFWLGLVCGFVLVLAAGWEQHFGGLEATRKYFFLYVYPQSKDIPPEYLKKLSSTRIFSTLFYPNSLAGALLLLLPPVLGAIWRIRRFFTPAAGGFLALLIAVPALACLFWSGSKGGWLLMLALIVIALLRLPFGRRHKTVIIIMLVLLGGVGFAVKYAGFFRKGATSVVARFDYWRAALQTTGAHPLLGAGPGTFAITYGAIKRPEAEMARLVHNDYLEQACDSGIPGFLLYAGFVAAAVFWTASSKLAPKSESGIAPASAGPVSAGAVDWMRFSVWLGVLGWALQSFVEFDLYLPALAWPAFSMLGWLVGTSGRAAVRVEAAEAATTRLSRQPPG